MNKYAEVVVLVEGPTEQQFVKQLLTPYLAQRGVYLTPIILDKPGEKGGDVKFARAKNDIEKHLKQRQDTCVTMLVDYYGIRSDWPGYSESKKQAEHTRKAQIMNQATHDEFKKTSTGIAIAKAIGIPKMREACPLFNTWVTALENLGH